MRLLKFFLFICVFTVLSLVYIELQVQIYELGYQGENKKTEVQKLTDNNSDVIYNICKLKSANNLGIKLLADNSNMRFLDNKHIVQLRTPVLLEGSDLVKTQVGSLVKKPNLLASIFSLKSQAEAEPQNKILN